MSLPQRPSPERPRRRTVPVPIVAVLGFGLGFMISGWFGGIMGLALVLVASRLF